MASKDAQQDRPYDIVLFGATGFTGGLTADYLAAHAPAACRWALVGRNKAKLEQVRERLAADHPGCADLPLLVADATDADSLREVAESARVVVTTVGPYLEHGEPLVAACAEAGTDYVDLTGEPEFVDRMYLAHHDRACETGARLVHCCGFDSIPHDLGAQFTRQHLPADAPATVRGVVRSNAAFSGGTFHSALGQMSRGRQMQKASSERRAKEPRPEGGRKVRAQGGRPQRDPVLGYWLLPLPTIDPFVVKRSAAALADYGPAFTYSHYAGFKTLRYALGAVAGMATMMGAIQVPPLREQLKKRVPQGSGPSETKRGRSWFTVEMVGEGGGRRVVTEVAGGDPGYTETAKMLAESALSLAFDPNPVTFGQVTTAVAMGDNLRERLTKSGISFTLVKDEPIR
ncbi:saccharopine dehydrogenase family protein [Nocardioides marmoribigeumensis]|uniref:Short subunit dehydrogenase-like uncharacterized protein n=1 Tax=Nocardioides marmoribigeumensis TaxID=433649 RepID=A0ABU2BZD7_9ACTN|nr:saccharopine dehydrogenase NADP-binding domain-containing protein [Nocardioides marmoribigeumensis]MDR7363747.1 short subunit dehydrogenase-like uncharacterized protein [Nocardioides marmoribigeumensis]